MVTRFVICLFVILMSPGCSHFNRHMMTPAYHPQNVFKWAPELPAQVHRVAVLPIACDTDNPDLLDGCDALEPVIRQELAKTHRFEVTAVSQEALRGRTGKPVWNCEETLPQDLLAWIADTWACDAVMFCRLTVFRGYPPLAVGWRMRLVEITSKRTLWAGDEIFDGGQPAVQAGARQFQFAELQHATSAPEEWLIQNSPRQFGQYAAAELFATLPNR